MFFTKEHKKTICNKSIDKSQKIGYNNNGEHR